MTSATRPENTGVKPDPKTGVLMVLLAAALWGTTGTAQALAGGGLAPVWFGALRLVVAMVFFAAYSAVLNRGQGLSAPARSTLPLGPVLGAGLCMAVYNLAFFAGIRSAGVAVGTAIALGSGPLWTGLMQALVTRQVPAIGWWIGTVVAISGGLLMTLSGTLAPGGSGLATAPDTAGIALCLVSGLGYAGYTLLNQGLVRTASPSRVTLQTFAVAALLAVAAAFWNVGPPQPTAADGWAVLYVGVATAGVAYLLFGHALQHLSAANAVTLALVEPVVAFTLASGLLGERPSTWAFVGLVLVLAGVLAVVRSALGRRTSAA